MDTSKELNIKFEEGISRFSFSIYDAIPKNGNECLSPYSVSVALLLLSLGTNGTTEKQMLSSIFNSEIPDDVHRGYQILDGKLSKRTQKDVTLSIANGVFASKLYTVVDTYKANALKYYRSDFELLDFKTKSEESRRRINNWISSATKDKIRDMLSPGTIHGDTIMVLANAIYFKGTWEKQFSSNDTQKRNFVVGPNDLIEVDMMHGKFNAASGVNNELDCKVLQLPYAGNELSMIFILPNDQSGLSKLESSLTFSTFNSIIRATIKQETIVRIPKFVVETHYDLKPILSKLGITKMFDPTAADFTKIILPEECMAGAYISTAIHNAVIEVNEEGSEAAAATVLAMVPGCAMPQAKPPPFEFVADHPFMFIIMDNKTRTVMFIGRYVHP